MKLDLAGRRGDGDEVNAIGGSRNSRVRGVAARCSVADDAVGCHVSRTARIRERKRNRGGDGV